MRTVARLFVAGLVVGMFAAPAHAITQYATYDYSNCLLVNQFDSNIVFSAQKVTNQHTSEAVIFFCNVGSVIGELEPNDIYDITVYVNANSNLVDGWLCFHDKYGGGTCGAWDGKSSSGDTYLQLFPPAGSYSASTYHMVFYVSLGEKTGSDTTAFYSYKVWKD